MRLILEVFNQMTRPSCAPPLSYYSLKYHRLHPEYIHQRIERLGHSYSLRILLLLCDIVSLVSFIRGHGDLITH